MPLRKVVLTGEYFSAIWLSQHEFVGTRSEKNHGQTYWRFSDDGSELQQILLMDDAQCTRATRYLGLSKLPDGRLGLIKDCLGRWPKRDITDERYLVAYDPDLGTIEQIVAGPLPDRNLSGPFTWNPEMTRGVQLASNRLFGSLYWITPSGIEPITATVGNDQHSWSLDVDIQTLMNSGQSNVGLPGEAAWAPDGKLIAFWASPDAIGREGQLRLDSEWSLYVMDPIEQKPQSILDGIHHAFHLAWSPNSKWLAFYGQRGTQSGNGLWLCAPENETLELVTEVDGRFRGSPMWSPDGKEIAAIRFDESSQTTELRIYDVTEISQMTP